MQRILTGSDDHLFAYTFYILFSLSCGGLAAALTLCVAPKAVGSGIPELMGILNGVEIPNMFSWSLLGVKSIGVVLAVAATLCIGKEGPLAHIGACLAVLTMYLPLSFMKQFQTDDKKREFVAMGMSAGISVAFGSPIGGTLMAYELSSPNTFWTFSLLWKNFICSALSTFVLASCMTLKEGKPLMLSDAGALKFTLINPTDPSSINEIIGSLVLGVCGGLVGALFITANMILTEKRKSFVKTKMQKFVEVLVFVGISATLFFWLATLAGRCIPRTDASFSVYHSAICSQHQYNPLATLLFNTEGDTIRAILAKGVDLAVWEVTLFMTLWTTMTTITYGISVPAGLFLPAIIIGCSMGQIYSEAVLYMG